MAGETVRLEIRALASDVERWKDEADRLRMPLSEYVRQATREVATPSPFRELISAVRDMMARHQQATQTREGTLHLTREHELALMHATEREVGGEIMGRLVVGGPRAAFPALYGYSIRWDAHAMMIAPIESNSR
jgi:hypothetical protein